MGYKKGDLSCDRSYTYLMITDRDVSARPEEGVLPGEFNDGDAHLIGVSLGYKL